ncbi:MAG: hypothetical protein J6A01_11880 [Proteobacteria bacterium]|nr:hypothetical protein [Pseudomonadota bacterium]
MSNPFRKASVLKRLFSLLVLVTFSFSFSPVAMAQGDFDFSDGDDSGAASSDDFNFDDAPPAPLELEKKFVMPNNGKPVNLVIFVPVDGTPEKTLEQLTESTVEMLKDEKYSQYDSVEGIPINEKLAAMSEDDRLTCSDDPSCLANMGREIGASNIIVGRIYTENRDRPQITFDLIEVSTAVNKNSIFFDTQNRLRKQEQDISGALMRLFNIDTGSIDSLITQREVEESAPLPLGQLIGGIIVGVVALGAIGTGIYFGVEAKNLDDKVKKAIDANKAVSAMTLNAGAEGGNSASTYNALTHQKAAKDDYDKASDYAMLANILYASGAVLAVVSVILFLVRPERDDEDIFANDLYISPSVGDNGGGVVAGFTF